MERQELIEKFREVIKSNNPTIEMETLFYKILDKESRFIKREPHKSYRICAILYYAILCEMAEGWKLTENNLKEAKYFQKLLK